MAAVATVNTPDAMMAAVTWIANQYECRAGTSGAGATYKHKHGDAQRQHDRRHHEDTEVAGRLPRHHDRNAVTAVNASASVNSYMLPHGNRCTAAPRLTIAPQMQQPADDGERPPRPCPPGWRRTKTDHERCDLAATDVAAAASRRRPPGHQQEQLRGRRPPLSSPPAPRAVVAESGVDRVAEERQRVGGDAAGNEVVREPGQPDIDVHG